MIGQTKLVRKFNSYSIKTLPKTILLIGPKGCGKHLLVQEQAQRLGLPIEQVDLHGQNKSAKKKAAEKQIEEESAEDIELKADNTDTQSDFEKIVEIQSCPIRKIYLFDLNQMSATGRTDKYQNTILKLLEEPSQNAFIVLLAESEVSVLETVLNRCTKFYFEQYTIDELKMTNWLNVYSNDLVYKICKTPGQLQCVNEQHVEELYNICSKLLGLIQSSTCANVVSLEYKFDYKQEFAGKYDFDMFFNMLEYVSFEDYLKNNRPTSLTIYKLTTEYRQKQIGRTLVKETLMINFLAMLWEAVR